MYYVRPQILPVISIISIIICWNILSGVLGGSLSLYLLILLLAIVLSSYRISFMIKNDHLVYEVTILFKILIYRKEIYPDQINQLKFFEVSWFKKAAVIKLIKGMNIRLAILESAEGYDHLLEFARKHDITTHKTKDYLWLEQRKKRGI